MMQPAQVSRLLSELDRLTDMYLDLTTDMDLESDLLPIENIRPLLQTFIAMTEGAGTSGSQSASEGHVSGESALDGMEGMEGMEESEYTEGEGEGEGEFESEWVEPQTSLVSLDCIDTEPPLSETPAHSDETLTQAGTDTCDTHPDTLSQTETQGGDRGDLTVSPTYSAPSSGRDVSESDTPSVPPSIDLFSDLLSQSMVLSDTQTGEAERVQAEKAEAERLEAEKAEAE
ncbi:hypothetical protein KIPB_015246, partial [Kipferlia bialata]|eukprot:g15246.t1